jgi:hypothetical protein
MKKTKSKFDAKKKIREKDLERERLHDEEPEEGRRQREEEIEEED